MEPQAEELFESIAGIGDKRIKIEFTLTSEHAVEVITFVAKLLERK